MPAINLRFVGYVCAAVALFAMGALVNGWRLTAQLELQARLHSDTLAEISRAAAHQVLAQQDKRQKLEAQLAAIDQQRYQELQHAQTITDSLTADLAAARQRLSVRITRPACSGTVPDSSGATRLDDGSGDRALIHPEDAAALASITGDADRCAVKLKGLQEWACKTSPASCPGTIFGH